MKPGPHVPILLVGGGARAALAACRWLGDAGHAAALLRWTQARSFADASRHCSQSVWLGCVDEGVEAWLNRLSALLESGRFQAVWPLDPLAHSLLCSSRWQAPQGVRVFGPRPHAHARATDRLVARELAAECGCETLPTVFLPRGATVAIDDSTLPCIVRSRFAVAIDADEPAPFVTRLIEGPRALDQKLRDDLPRVDVLLQAPVQGRRVDLLVVAHNGEMAFVAPHAAQGREFARRLARRLEWTGMLHLELLVDGDRTVFADLHCGPAALPRIAHADGVQAVEALVGGPSAAPARIRWPDALTLIARAAGELARVADKLTVRARAQAWRLCGGSGSSRPLHPHDAVLFVCKGNINRSLVAEQVLRHLGFTRVSSAGLIGLSGRRASRPAERYIQEVLGRPADELKSQSLRRALASMPRVDVVVCFERRHVVELLDRHPELRGRVHLLTTLSGARDGPLDIGDPHGLDDSDHRDCFERIARLLERAQHRAPAARALALPPRAPTAQPRP